MLIVTAKALDEQDDAFNAWYDETHLADVLTVPGIVAAQRFVAVPSVHGERPEVPYLAIYELEADDEETVARTLAALSKAAKSMDISPVFDRSVATSYAYVALGERVEA